MTTYTALSTANLPDPAIDPAAGEEANDHFNTALYTGTGSNQSVTVGFQPDFTWIKERNSSTDHALTNATVGASKYLKSTGGDAESDSNTFVVQSFDSNGFTIGTSGNFNGSSDTYVSWNWNMGGSTVSGTATGGGGSRAYSYRASTKAGLSVLAYTGDGTDGGEVPHGLSGGVDAVFIKKRNASLDWHCFYASGLLTGEGYFLSLNKTDGQSTTSYGTADLNDSGTALTLKAGGNGSRNVNASSDTYVAYIFKNVDGFSKVGAFEGNGDTGSGGPFIYTGFRPAWVMIKPADEGRDWRMYDNKRDVNNRAENPLQANTTAAEADESSTGGVDLLSNGFKVRTDNAVIFNSNGNTMIYMAFAEQPFKFANAR